VAPLAADACALLLWCTGPHIAIGTHVEIIKAWGFKPSTAAFVWVKQNPSGRGCDTGGDVIKLVQHLDGIDFASAVRALAGEPPPKINGKDRKEFLYTDASGTIVSAVERIEGGTTKDGKRRKTFRQKRPDPDHPGKWIWNIEGVPVVPYRLPELTEAIAADRPVLIVEGEKKADLLWYWNVAATCNAGGVKKWKPEHSEFLKDADVVLVPDNDNAGWEHIHAVGASLVGVAKHIRVLVLPHVKAKDDIVDWAKGGGTREQLDELLDKAQDWQPPSAGDQQNDDAKAAAKTREDELLDALAKAQGLDYVRERKAAAKELGVGGKAIDDEVKARREDAKAAPLYGHWITEPWPEPVDGDSLLRDIIKRIQRHVVITDDNALTIALWVMMSWVHDEIAIHSPFLNVNSAEPESGKTTTMGVISFLMPKCIATVDASEAAIYRAIHRWQPSFAIDEFDDVLASNDKNKAALKSVINSGHTRGQGVLRCLEPDFIPFLFSTFAPKAIGMVGRKLPPATLSRCIFVELRRRRKGEHFEKFTHVDDSELADLRRRLFRWSMDNEDALRKAQPSIPDELQNRCADNWQIQFAIADLCSGVEDFGEKARAAASKIEGKADSRTTGVQLLTDVKALFDNDPTKDLFGDKQPCLSSATIVDRLVADPEGPWAEFYRGRPLTQNRLAKLLGAYRITSQTVSPPGQKDAKGYYRHQFEEVWAFYVL
jgi:putative DNA primase/helicase